MDYRTYRVALTGTAPLLLHADNLDWAEALKVWRAEPENKKTSVAGDDRSPAWSWIGCVYHDGVSVGVSSDNLMTTLREGGARVGVAGGKRGLTYKRQSQSGLLVNEVLWPVTVNAAGVPWADVSALQNEADFTAHQERAKALGFELFVKRARIGQAKHVRVRPRFNVWSVAGTITVFDETITRKVLEDILYSAGRYSGLGDWRPSSPKAPGPFGTFTAAVEVET